MDNIEWEIHQLITQINQIEHRIELEIVFSANNPNVHYHTSKFDCELPNCAGPSPYWLLMNTLETAWKRVNDKYPNSPLPEIA